VTHASREAHVAAARRLIRPGAVQARKARRARTLIMQRCDARLSAGPRIRVEIAEESEICVALQLQSRHAELSEDPVHDNDAAGEGVRERLDRILSAYEEVDRRFTAAGGLGTLLNLYEQVRREIERVSFEELDRMALEIKTVIEALLKMDYELRKVHNLKVAFETRAPGTSASG
jgi:hypothetical protein